MLEFIMLVSRIHELRVKNHFCHALLIVIFCFDSQAIQASVEKSMADSAADSALKYLRDPALAAGLGAVALASMYYLTSRPTPQPCPVDPQQQSFELPVTTAVFLPLEHDH